MSKNINNALRHADRLMSRRRVREAIAVLEPLRADHPDHFHVVYMLGLAYMVAGDLDLALDALTEATTLRPDHPKANTALGFVFARKGEFDRALEFFVWSLRLDPQDLEAMRGQGGVLAQLGRYDEAIAQWQKMEGAAERSITVQFGLGQIHEQCGAFNEAIKHYRQVLHLPGDTRLHEVARQRMARIVTITMGPTVDLKMDVVFYCLSALERFTSMDRKNLHRVLLEIALAGREGLDVNDPMPKYRITLMAGSYNGLQLVSFLYTGFKVLKETMDVGMDLSQEYEIALEMWGRVEGA